MDVITVRLMEIKYVLLKAELRSPLQVECAVMQRG